MQKIIVLFLTFLLVLSACGSDKDSRDTGLEGVDHKSTATTVSPDTDTEANNSSDTQPVGYLAYIQDGVLVVLDLATQTTQQVGQGVLPDYLYSSPDQTAVYFTAHDTTQNKIFFYGYTFKDGSIQQIAEAQPSISASGSLWFLYGWSPNAEWAILLTTQMGIRSLLVNTQQSMEPIALSNTLLGDPLWTTDNQLITVAHENGMPPIDMPVNEYFAPIESIQQIHTPDGIITDLTSLFTLDSITSDTELHQAIEANDIDLSDFPTESIPEIWIPAGRRHQENRSQYCWQYHIAQDNEIRYMAEDVYILGNLENLTDGSAVFMQIEFADCSFLSGPTGKLVLLTGNNIAIVLTDALTSIRDRNNPDPFFLQGRYDIAPQQNYAVFIATDESGARTTLNMVDINGDEAMPVMVNGETVENVVGVVWGQ